MTDEELVELCKTGDESGFEQLIERYHKPLFNYIMSFTSDRQLAEDLVQETFIKMINGIEKYSSRFGAKFSTWLFTVARNTVTDEFRKRKIRDALPIDENEFLIVSSESLEEQVILKDSINSLAQALDTLPPESKSMIYLKYHMDLSYKEISSIFSYTPEKVKWRLHDALEKLRKMLKGKEVKLDGR